MARKAPSGESGKATLTWAEPEPGGACKSIDSSREALGLQVGPRQAVCAARLVRCSAPERLLVQVLHFGQVGLQFFDAVAAAGVG